MLLRLRKGQGTLEYAILFAVVIATAIAISIILRPKISGSYTTLGTKMKAKLDSMDFN